MRTLGMALLAAVVFVALGGSAFAQGQPGKGEKPAVQGKKVKTLVYGQGDELKGEIILPEGDGFVARGPAEKGSLIRLRVEFVREIVKSTETL